MSRPWIPALVVVVSLISSGGARGDAFLRGDADSSSVLNVTDAIRILHVLFLPDPPPTECQDALDANDDGRVNLSDAVVILEFLFRRGRQLPEPFPNCGRDPTEDELTCETGGRCETARGVYFVIDRSNVAGGAGLNRARREVSRRIRQLTEDVEFAIVAYDQGVSQFPGRGMAVEATAENIEEALAWIANLAPGRGSCIREGLLEAVRISQRDDLGPKVIPYFGFGSPRCSGNNLERYRADTLERVTALNDGRARIDCFGISPLSADDESFLMTLAARNLGAYMRIE